jgi:hypothetical protein
MRVVGHEHGRPNSPQFQSTEPEFEVVFAKLAQQTSRRGLSIAADPVFSSRLEQLATLTRRYGSRGWPNLNPNLFSLREPRKP